MPTASVAAMVPSRAATEQFVAVLLTDRQQAAATQAFTALQRLYPALLQHRQSEVQAVAERWANDAGWSVTGVTATGDEVLIEATGPNPAPGLTLLRHDLNAAGLNRLDVRVNLIPASYQSVPK